MIGTVTGTSVFDNDPVQQEKNTALPNVRRERRSALQVQVGEVFNPFQLFIGAMIPSAVLRNPDLSPSAKLVFARLAQFAGRQGKAWPSDQTLGREVGLGDRQARRCVAELERYGLIRRVSRSGHSNLFEFLWHAIYEEGPMCPPPPSKNSLWIRKHPRRLWRHCTEAGWLLPEWRTRPQNPCTRKNTAP